MRRLWVPVVIVTAVVIGLFQTPSGAAPATTHFTAAGDYGWTANTDLVLRGMAAANADYAVALGDLSYSTAGNEPNWCTYVLQRLGAGYPFELLTGNHESNGVNGAINEFAACLPNQLPGVVGTYGKEFYVDTPAVNPTVRQVFIAPNITMADGSTWSYAAASSHYAWTAAAIDGARAKGIPWVVVNMHKPCLNVGAYGCDVGADLANLLVTKKVDLVLSGHEHIYARTKQLGGANCPGLVPGSYTAACVADADNAYVQGRGTVFAVVGTGGVDMRTVNTADTEAPYFAAWSGTNANPAYGFLDVQATASQLSARFVPVGGATMTDAFTVTTAGTTPNQPPVAAATGSCTGLTCTVSGTGSSDPDGTIAGYSWSFGDGGTASSGATPSHTYATAGNFTATLTVTDNAGATATAQVALNPSAPTTVIADDSFTRTVTAGLGTAPVGGAWTLTGDPADFAVAAGVGTLRVNPAISRAATLTRVSSTTASTTLLVKSDKQSTGGASYVSVIGRRVTAQGDYRLVLTARPDGTMTAGLVRVTTTGAETTLAAAVPVAGAKLATGVQVRLDVTGTSPTTIRAKVWPAGTAEPTAWTVSASDSTVGLQAAGTVGLNVYLSRAATNAPVTVSMDNVRSVR